MCKQSGCIRSTSNPNLFQPVGHFFLHLLQGRFSCLVLMNDFMPRLFQLSQELLHPALQLKKQKSMLVENLARLPSQQGDTSKKRAQLA